MEKISEKISRFNPPVMFAHIALIFVEVALSVIELNENCYLLCNRRILFTHTHAIHWITSDSRTTILY